MTLILEPSVPVTHTMIWMHGLGASNQDMYGLAQALSLETLPIRHICLQAEERAVTINQFMKMPAWYDIVGTSLTDREDKAGILESEQQIKQVIEQQQEAGISSAKILLAGFSQGGAMALHTGLRYENYLAGIVALSCYLPLAVEWQETTLKQRKSIPIFFGYGAQDQIVWPIWSQQTQQHLEQQGLKRISCHQYDMMHEVCAEELQDLRKWLVNLVG